MELKNTTIIHHSFFNIHYSFLTQSGNGSTAYSILVTVTLVNSPSSISR